MQKLVSENDIPDNLIINFDQTNVYIVPAGHYTLEKSGAKQVPIIGLEDKRQITVVLGCTLSGDLLPPQVIYQGLTAKCHPSYTFPESWHITESENHWSNTNTMLAYIEKILVPYIESVREQLPLRKSDTPALLTFDVFAAHKTPVFKKALDDANIKYRYVPASCTGELQPLDLSGNDVFKRNIKSSFQKWYGDQVSTQIQNGTTIDNVKVDLRLSTLKPFHAQWLVDSIDSVSKQVVANGWKQAGLKDAIDSVRK